MKWLGVIALFLAAGAFLYFMIVGTKTKLDPTQFNAVGDFAAEEAAKLIGNSGTIVMIYDIVDPKSGSADAGKPFADQGARVDAFRKRMAKLGSYTFAPDVKLLRPPMVYKSVWPEASWSKLASANASATIVLFSGPPNWTNEEQAALTTRSGKLVVVGGTVPEMEPLAKAKLVHLAIAARMPVPPPSAKSETPRQATERVYAVLTPDSPSGR